MTSQSRNLEKAALRGEPSYVWRAGQERRLQMILEGFGNRINGKVLENGCGIGMYVQRLQKYAGEVVGLEYDFERVYEASSAEIHPAPQANAFFICAAGECLPFPDESFDAVLSHEVLEHVNNDQQAVAEMVRTLKPGGRIVVFVPNRGYPFETHGIYWRGEYRFGNIPLVNWLPRKLRDHLAPHVKVYAARDLENLFSGQSVVVLERKIIFGAYDNIIARWGEKGKWLRSLLQKLERTPLRIFGLSHYWVIEKKNQP